MVNRVESQQKLSLKLIVKICLKEKCKNKTKNNIIHICLYYWKRKIEKKKQETENVGYNFRLSQYK